MPEHRVNTQFGPYRLDALLGRGGMGEVYRAYDTGKDRVVALKLLKESLAHDTVYQERFRRESHAAARLGEPHVIPIHDWGEIDGVLFIDMRLVEGEDLRAVLRRERVLAPERAVAIVEQIAAALDAAHAGGLVHRDIKPENILVGENDFAYLLDFGIAYAAQDTHLTQAGTTIGSIAYMAPELFDAAEVTPATDIYGLACVLFECLTGRVPHPADTISAAIKAAVLEPPPAPSAVNAGVPPALDAVIDKGLAADPARRFATARDLARAARAALDPRPVAAVGDFDRTNVIRAPQTVIAPTSDGPGGYAGVPGVGAAEARYPGTQQYSGPVFQSGPQPPAGGGVRQQGPPKRSVAVPILLGLIAVAVIALLVLGGIWLFGSKSDNRQASSTTVTQVVSESAPPSSEISSQAPPSSGPAAPPPGSVPCDATVGIGTSVTTCPFAAAVRDAYLAAGPKGESRVVTAVSPVTGRTYQMSCAPESGIVICRGGDNAVVHIY